MLEHLKREEEALAAYDQALALDPTQAVFYQKKARLLWRLKRYGEAAAVALQARHLW